MTDKNNISLERVIKGLQCCQECDGYTCRNCCPYYDRNEPEDQPTCTCRLAHDAFTLLKAREARLVTEADFENGDAYGFLPVWVEDKDDSEIVCDCITKAALTDMDSGYCYRFWTSRPDEKRRAETPWQQ